MLVSEEAMPRRSRGRPRVEEGARLQTELLDVALKEFLANGYDGTSMSRIVRAAGVSKTTLYSRFSSKEELFRAILNQQIDNLAAVTTLRPRSGPLDLVRGLKSYANRTLEISLEGDLLEVNRLIYSEANRFPELGIAAAERTRRGIFQVADFIRECALADGVPCRNPEAVSEAFISMLRGWYVNVMLINRPVAAAARRRWADNAVDIFVSGRADW